MHNGQLSDPQNEWSKAISVISGKRDKTDADFAEIARLEWYGGLYVSDGKPCIPAEAIEAAILEGARKSRKGKVASAGIFCESNCLLHYDGEADIKTLWDGGQHALRLSVRIQRARVMRTRPRFDNWYTDLFLMYDPKAVNEREVRDFVTVAGDSIGICEWRPKFGRFVVE